MNTSLTDSGTPRGAVVITGTSTGIGRACALSLDDPSFRVFAGVRKSTGPGDPSVLRPAARVRRPR